MNHDTARKLRRDYTPREWHAAYLFQARAARLFARTHACAGRELQSREARADALRWLDLARAIRGSLPPLNP